MTKPNGYKAYFTLAGDFDPIEITKSIGIEPSETWRKGDRNEQTHFERRFSRWSLNSRLSETATLEDQIADVLEQLKPRAEAILGIQETLDGWLQLVGWFYRDYPGLHFSQELITGLAQLNLSVDFDFYYMYSDRREDS
jgi:hypothetical protein